MWKRGAAAILLVTMLFMPLTAFARTEPLEKEMPFETEAVSVLLLDAKTGTVILEKNADEQRPVASITKLMTILLTLEAIDEGKVDLQQEITVSAHAAGMGGSQALLDAGGVYSVEELLKSMIVASANDSAVALAELMASSEEGFAGKMNERAKQLGLAGTNYLNATGLPANGQYTTARDIAVLSMEVMKHPLYFEYSTIWLDEIKHKNDRVTQLVNTNRLVRFYEGADGVKTGSTNEAGYCISATAERAGDRFIAVVLGAETGKKRFALAQKLLDHAFANYTTKTFFKVGEIFESTVPVTGARVESVSITVNQDILVTIHKAQESEIEMIVNLPESLKAPVLTGEKVGEVQIVCGDEYLYTADAIVAQDVKKANIFGYLSNVFKEWMKG